MRVDGGRAYVANRYEGLRVVDVSDPAAPRDVGLRASYAMVNDVEIVHAAQRTYALVARDDGPTDVFDVTSPEAPTPVATLGRAHTIFLEKRPDRTLAYLAGGGLGVDIWDVTDPTAALLVSEFVHPDVELLGGLVHEVYAEGGRVYLAYWNLGLVVLDVTDPALPVELGELRHEGAPAHSVGVTTLAGCRTAVLSDEGWGGGVRLVGVDDACPGSWMTGVGAWSRRPQVSAHDLWVAGDRVWVAHYQDGLRVLDLADPTAPVEVAWWNGWAGPGRDYFEGTTGLHVDAPAGLIYVADSVRGLVVLRAE